MRRIPLLFLLSLFLFIRPNEVVEASPNSVSLAVANGLNQVALTIHPFGAEYGGRPRIASADLGGDGVAEIVLGAGRDKEPRVHILRQDGSEIRSFLAYDEKFRGGITVATCDIDGDGMQDIITGTQRDGGPHIRSFDGFGNLLSLNFFAYGEDFRSGVEVACTDLTGDGKAEIITVPSAGGGPHLKVFSNDGILLMETFIREQTYDGGLSIAAGDLNGDGKAEIIVGETGIGSSSVFVFRVEDEMLKQVSHFPVEEIQDGVFVQVLHSEKTPRIAITPQWSKQASVILYNETGTIVKKLSPFTDQSERGLVIAEIQGAPFETYSALSLGRKVGHSAGKYIYVDVSEQTLSAFENGVLQNKFLISTGRKGRETPLGITSVTDKLLWHDYRWYYGPNDPRNYYVPNVQYNLRFRQYYYIHYAYWHRNFGQQMSSGCVNVNFENAEWIYFWSEVGTPVEIGA